MPQCHHSFKLRRLESTDRYEIPVHLLASEKLSDGFLSHIPSSPHRLPLPHPQVASGIPSCCSAGVPGKSESKVVFFFFSFSFSHCATFLNVGFPIRQRLISCFPVRAAERGARSTCWSWSLQPPLWRAASCAAGSRRTKTFSQSRGCVPAVALQGSSSQSREAGSWHSLFSWDTAVQHAANVFFVS